MRGCPGKLYTNLDATGVIRKSEHAELAAEYLRPVSEIYDELASNASNNLDTAVYFSSWDQARNTKYYSRAKRYPRLLARRQDLRLTAEQTTTKSGWCEAAGAEMGHLRLSHPALHSKAEELGVQLAPAKFVCDFKTSLIPSIQGNFPNIRVQAFLLVNLVPAGFEILNVGTSGPVVALLDVPTIIWKVGTAARTKEHVSITWDSISFFNIDEHGKTENVVRHMDDGYTRGKGCVKRITCRLHCNEVSGDLFVVDC
ncbi:hypothetical protein T4C_4331 [Trichinella pseudospiralis]|uniref:Uncharacterized protein n=1 Tax=Trichinella pseudospiralis TaxID=6337 RepID=A0A0V1KAU5_TRIPS|nr:hypothetical protein T4C_4331 [Trichinella pseudospiralis]